MILTGKELTEAVNAPDYDGLAALAPASRFVEFRRPTIDEDGTSSMVEKDVGKNRDYWKLTSGSYQVELDCTFDLDRGQFAMVVPSTNTLQGGSYAVSRPVAGDSPTTLFHVTKPVDVHEGSTVAGVMVFNTVWEDEED
ncbi:MAG: hypothetical protein ABEH81_01315 [Halopenitus sp.]